MESLINFKLCEKSVKAMLSPTQLFVSDGTSTYYRIHYLKMGLDVKQEMPFLLLPDYLALQFSLEILQKEDLLDDTVMICMEKDQCVDHRGRKYKFLGGDGKNGYHFMRLRRH